jgi:hypothetical protein
MTTAALVVQIVAVSVTTLSVVAVLFIGVLGTVLPIDMRQGI